MLINKKITVQSVLILKENKEYKNKFLSTKSLLIICLKISSKDSFSKI